MSITLRIPREEELCFPVEALLARIFPGVGIIWHAGGIRAEQAKDEGQHLDMPCIILIACERLLLGCVWVCVREAALDRDSRWTVQSWSAQCSMNWVVLSSLRKRNRCHFGLNPS